MTDLDSISCPFHNKIYKKVKMDQKNQIMQTINKNKFKNLNKKLIKKKILKIKYSKPKTSGFQSANNKTIM